MRRKLAVWLCVCVCAGVVCAQVFTGPRARSRAGAPIAINQNRKTWIHVETPGGSGPYHFYIRVDTIIGLGGPFPWWNNEQQMRMSLYTDDDRYPTCRLPDLGSLEANLGWAEAVERVVRENPGGIVELVDFLP